MLGTPAELAAIVREYNVERVVVAFFGDSDEQGLDTIRELKKLNVQIDIVPRLFEAIGPHVTVHEVEGLAARRPADRQALPGLADDQAGRRRRRRGASCSCSRRRSSRSASWRIRRDSPGPVLFRQTRLGQGRRPFTVLKFRTMRVDTDDAAAPRVHRADDVLGARFRPRTASTSSNRDDAITPFGRLLRKTSLDELPQLINVLRGEMSLVGPRPCLAYETEHFAPHHFERFDVPQGITGLWQVTARAHATLRRGARHGRALRAQLVAAARPEAAAAHAART